MTHFLSADESLRGLKKPNLELNNIFFPYQLLHIWNLQLDRVVKTEFPSHGVVARL